jgi:hypothetical protein
VIRPRSLRRQTVELQEPARPSRIRRDPAPAEKPKAVRAYPTEQEIWTVVIGVIVFALAITVATVGISNAIN